MYPKLNPSSPPPPPPLQSWVLRWVIAYQKHKNFPLSPFQAGAPPLYSAKLVGVHEGQTGNCASFCVQTKSIYGISGKLQKYFFLKKRMSRGNA